MRVSSFDEEKALFVRVAEDSLVEKKFSCSVIEYPTELSLLFWILGLVKSEFLLDTN